MARYHFNIADGTEQFDPVGTELDSLQQVRHEALPRPVDRRDEAGCAQAMKWRRPL
jgi:hypothetical protein